ncbi:MAG: Mut7-C RNAse domain-containing protein [Halanaeroarchaeum sp.]
MATPADTRVLLDAMCGGMRSILRMIGYDTAYALDRGVEADEAVLDLATSEDRLLVTRNRSLADAAPRAVLVESKDPDEQLAELAAAGLELELDRPVRCSACNGPLERVGAGEPTPEYAPDPGETDVWRCRDCGQAYWMGSHWADVRRRLAAL